MSRAGLTACGGYQTQTTCHTLIAGQWEQSATLVMARFDHVSWRSANGTFLMGGSGDARQTSERLNNTDITNSTGFNLQYDTMYAIYVLSQNSQVATMHIAHSENVFKVLSNTFLSDACAIELADTVVVTGGQWSASRVQVYSVSGPQEELPNMLAPRYGHACGLFVNSDQQTVSSNKYAIHLK